MSAFASATAALFRDPNLAQDALWRSGGAGVPVAVRVMLRRPDAVTGFGEGRFVTDSVMIDVECAALGTLAPGDTFEIRVGTTQYRPVSREWQTILYPAGDAGGEKRKHP